MTVDGPKDYYEAYKARFSKKDMDDSWLDGLGIGVIGTALVFVGLIAAVKFIPIF